jgi:hypothetical protein
MTDQTSAYLRTLALPLTSKVKFFIPIAMSAIASVLKCHSSRCTDGVPETYIEEYEDAIQVFFPCRNTVAINRDRKEPLPQGLLFL